LRAGLIGAVERFGGALMTARCKVLILGGYGTFGGRLAQLLGATQGVQLIIAGRSMEKAAAFCASLPAGFGHSAARIDRDADLKAQIAAPAPDVLVDASGPFQAYGKGPYRVVQAALDLGIHYLDLADGSDFVTGIRQFDAPARKRGIFVLSGVSSFPVLTLAVLRHLMQGVAQLETVHGGIAPSPYAGVGLNVIHAIASYAGQPVRLTRNGRDARGYALTETVRYTIAPPGRLPLKPVLFSLVDVPDLRAIPEEWPHVKEAWIGAGPVPEVLHRGLNGFSWLVRLGLVRSLAPFAKLFYFAINHLRWGDHRGGVFVAITGRMQNGSPVARSWHMVAEADDGPLIPSMAAEALIRRCADGRQPAPGARAATAELELSDYRQLFASRAIYEGTRDDLAGRDDRPLYLRILGEAWSQLPPAVRAMHDFAWCSKAEGRAKVERGTGLLSRVVGAVFRFPIPGDDVPVSVTFTSDGKREIWRRDFAGREFTSVQREGEAEFQHLVVERFGPFEFAMALVIEDDRLNLVLRGWKFLGLRLPLRWAPSGKAYETVEEERFRFFVEIAHPLCGLIVRYQGYLLLSS
jgi:hypothetical protein